MPLLQQDRIRFLCWLLHSLACALVLQARHMCCNIWCGHVWALYDEFQVLNPIQSVSHVQHKVKGHPIYEARHSFSLSEGSEMVSLVQSELLSLHV